MIFNTSMDQDIIDKNDYIITYCQTAQMTNLDMEKSSIEGFLHKRYKNALIKYMEKERSYHYSLATSDGKELFLTTYPNEPYTISKAIGHFDNNKLIYSDKDKWINLSSILCGPDIHPFLNSEYNMFRKNSMVQEILYNDYILFCITVKEFGKGDCNQLLDIICS